MLYCLLVLVKNAKSFCDSAECTVLMLMRLFNLPACFSKSVFSVLVLVGLFSASPQASEKHDEGVQAPRTLIVASAPWEEFTNSDHSGYYFDVLRSVFHEPEYSLDMRLVSYPGSLKMLADGAADIILGIYGNDVGNAHVSALPIEIEDLVVVLTPERARNWQGRSSLEGLTIGALEGYAFEGRLPSSANYSEYKTQMNMLHMLKAGRLDAVLEYKSDILPVIERYGSPFVLKEGLPQEKIHFAFREGPLGRALKETFDRRYQKLVNSGGLWELISASVTDAEDSYPFVCKDNLCVVKGE